GRSPAVIYDYSKRASLLTPLIDCQLLPRRRLPLLDRRRAACLEESAQLGSQPGQDLLITGLSDDVALLAGIGLHIVQLARPFLGALDVFQGFGPQPADVAVFETDAVAPFGLPSAQEPGVAVSG